MKCTNCGGETDERSEFCGVCGQSAEKSKNDAAFAPKAENQNEANLNVQEQEIYAGKDVNQAGPSFVMPEESVDFSQSIAYDKLVFEEESAEEPQPDQEIELLGQRDMSEYFVFNISIVLKKKILAIVSVALAALILVSFAALYFTGVFFDGAVSPKSAVQTLLEGYSEGNAKKVVKVMSPKYVKQLSGQQDGEKVDRKKAEQMMTASMTISSTSFTKIEIISEQILSDAEVEEYLTQQPLTGFYEENTDKTDYAAVAKVNCKYTMGGRAEMEEQEQEQEFTCVKIGKRWYLEM